MKEKEETSNKIPWFHLIPCGWHHRLGNIVGALINIAEHTIIVLSLGFIYPNFTWKWIMYRVCDSIFFNDPKKPEENGVHEES